MLMLAPEDDVAKREPLDSRGEEQRAHDDDRHDLAGEHARRAGE